MLQQLKEQVYKANMQLVKNNLVILTWGNVSGIDRDKGLVIIKPSGVDYEKMTADDMVTVDLNTGKTVEGNLKPSSDTPTHLELYKAFKNINGIVHTHSTWATVFSQACLEIIPLGTTHADYFNTAVPVTREMTKDEINSEYEKNTGKVITEAFNNIDPDYCPAVLVRSHGPFTWGSSPGKAVENAFVLEHIAFMQAQCIQLNTGGLKQMSNELLDKHFYRKHGEKAYYGQK
jgi:L-ribulose-5-phosphate 4-epimerase